MRSIRFLLLSALALVAMMALDNALAGKDEDNQLMVMETGEDEEEATVLEDTPSSPNPVDPDKIFIPTHEWQTVEPDQVLLPGLHVRINLQTGKKEAKFMDGDDGSAYMKSVERIKKTGQSGFSQRVWAPAEAMEVQNDEDPMPSKMRDDIVDALKNMKSEDGKTPEELEKESAKNKGKFRSFEEVKREFDELNLNVETDMEILQKLIEKYKSATSDSTRVTVLEDLEYLVHQFDNAIAFIDFGGLDVIVKPGLNSTSVEVKESILHLVGSAVQSNPKVQIAVLEAGLLQYLIQAVPRDDHDGVARKAVFALSCLVRGFPYGQQVLLQHGGLEALRRVFDRNDWQSLPIQLKVVSLLHDLLVERAQAEGERQHQLNRVKLDDYVARGGWCPAVSSLLAAASFDRRDRRYDMGAALRSEMPLRPDHDTVDKVVAAMGSMVSMCRYQFYETLPLLRHLATTYDDLAYKEQFQDDNEGHALFRSLADMISGLVRKIMAKGEL